MAIALAPGYSHRPPTEVDIPAILAVLHAYDMFFAGHADDYEANDIREDWNYLNPATDAWVFLAPDGSAAGYGTETNRDYGQLEIDGYTHPEHRGKGIGGAIITLGEARAQTQIALQPEGARRVP